MTEDKVVQKQPCAICGAVLSQFCEHTALQLREHTALQRIADELKRRPRVWLGHPPETWAIVAACYASPHHRGLRDPYEMTDGDDVPYDWPLPDRAWKPSPDDRIRELTMAGAFIVIELAHLLKSNELRDASASLPAKKSGAELIAEERRRQVEAEGYDAPHDDAHDGGEIIHVANEIVARAAGVHGSWDDPWGLIARHSRRPGGEVRLLVMAGALIAAEIDRVQRANSRMQTSEAKDG